MDVCMRGACMHECIHARVRAHVRVGAHACVVQQAGESGEWACLENVLVFNVDTRE